MDWPGLGGLYVLGAVLTAFGSYLVALRVQDRNLTAETIRDCFVMSVVWPATVAVAGGLLLAIVVDFTLWSLGRKGQGDGNG